MPNASLPSNGVGILQDDHPTPGEESSISSSLRCHPGLVRTENQDRVARCIVPLGELYLVADGVGGHGGGGQAAACAVEEYCRFLSAAPSTADPLSALQQATASVGVKLEEARRSAPPEQQGMASTIALVLLRGTTAIVGSLGDSRVYHARDTELTLLTRDHSVVREMVDRGILSEQDAQSHPSAHILTRSLGQAAATLEIKTLELRDRDTLLLCSDGLWTYAPNQQLAKALSDPLATTAQTADALLAQALAAGGGDNIGLALLRIGSTPSAPAKTSLPHQRSLQPEFLPRPGNSRLLTLGALAILILIAVCFYLWM